MGDVNWAEIVGKVAAGGWPSWIAAGVLALIGLVCWWLYQRGADRRAMEASQAERQRREADGDRENESAENAWDEARGRTDPGPGAGTEPRPPKPPAA